MKPNKMTLKGKVEVKNLRVVYQKNLCAVDNVSFIVNPGEFVCLIGPNGCGKTTVLNVIAGFISPTSGHILLDGNITNSPSPEKGFVFQKYVLFPWKTVIKNIEFGLKMQGLNEKKKKLIAKKFISLVQLEGFEKSYPRELSGGMEQRVGIARALANDPTIILMDEPFASLDAITKIRMQELLLEIHEKTKKTIIFVTHDIDEALLLSDRILIISKMPGTVKKVIMNDLPRPRTYNTTIKEGYVKQKKEIIKFLK